jgi:hypothetical protein
VGPAPRCVRAALPPQAEAGDSASTSDFCRAAGAADRRFDPNRAWRWSGRSRMRRMEYSRHVVMGARSDAVIRAWARRTDGVRRVEDVPTCVIAPEASLRLRLQPRTGAVTRVLPVALAGNTKLWRGKTLRLCIAAPLSALAAGARHVAEQAFVDR